MKLKPQQLQRMRWLRALEIAKACFYFEGYHTRYLEEIENYIREEAKVKWKPPTNRSS
jgi:hypothetical protein